MKGAPMFIIECPDSFRQEREYIVKVLFQEFLGLDYKIEFTNCKNNKIINDSQADGKELLIEDKLFACKPSEWLQPSSLPCQPLSIWQVDELPEVKLIDRKLPVIYGDKLNNGRYLKVKENTIQLSLDIFGSSFFMLTRYEESVKPNRDQHDRFPARASLAYQEGFLDRPIINEYLEIMWACFHLLWPHVKRKEKTFKVCLSHDVDNMFAVFGLPFTRIVRSSAGDLLLRRDLDVLYRRWQAYLQIKKGNIKNDIYYTFDRIMDISELHGLKSAFYFKTDLTSHRHDTLYVNNPYLIPLLRDINKRGHEIGLHPSYNTYKDEQQVKKEFNILLDICRNDGIKQDDFGGRQHYLRWSVDSTWEIWNNAGLKYDSSLTYADRAGFRCGTCYEYQTFNLKQRKPMFLIERPLIIMEGSLFGKKYMNLNYQEAYDVSCVLLSRCKKFNGLFTLLWHNSHFINKEDWHIYSLIISMSLNNGKVK